VDDPGADDAVLPEALVDLTPGCLNRPDPPGGLLDGGWCPSENHEGMLGLFFVY
jgi:hypothetical protein